MSGIITELFGNLNEELMSIKGSPITHDKPSAMEIVIKPEILDLSNIEEVTGNNSFRPNSFDEYIGQKKAKDRVECYIEGCKKFDETFPHTFFSAPAGCGKTVFANILANRLDKNFVSLTAGEIKSEQQLVDKIVECNGGILFVDECHRISKKVGTFMLPILEEGKINGKRIKPLTIIFATTHKGNLAEDLSALVQRFLQIDLEHYTKDELILIFKQFINKQYSNQKINDDVLKNIAINCRNVPRIGLQLLKEYIYIKDINQVKLNNNIVKNGVTEVDIKVLKYINEIDGASKNSLSKYLNVEPKTYEYTIEPFLIENNFITISNKRKITNKGLKFLESL